jgi:hypothetical protein
MAPHNLSTVCHTTAQVTALTVSKDWACTSCLSLCRNLVSALSTPTVFVHSQPRFRVGLVLCTHSLLLTTPTSETHSHKRVTLSLLRRVTLSLLIERKLIGAWHQLRQAALQLSQ